MTNATEKKVRDLKTLIRKETNAIRRLSLKVRLEALISELAEQHQKNQAARFTANNF